MRKRKRLFAILFGLAMVMAMILGMGTSVYAGEQPVVWEGEQAISGTNSVHIDKDKFAKIKLGDKIVVEFKDAAGEPMELRSNDKMLPGTRYSDYVHPGESTREVYATQAMIGSLKEYGLDVCGNFTAKKVWFEAGRDSVDENTVWSGNFWMDSWSTLELAATSFDGVDWSEIEAIRFISEAGRSDWTLNVMTAWGEGGKVADQSSMTWKDNYFELSLDKIDMAAKLKDKDSLLIQGNKEAGDAFNFTQVQLVPKALGPVPYMAWNEDDKKVEPVEGGCTDYTVVTDQTSWGTAGQNTWYVLKESKTISDNITVSGTVNLILCDGATLTASQGIATTGATLNIYAQSIGDTAGSLVANGSALKHSAGIGGNGIEVPGGTVNINGGKITATGPDGTAGIGGGQNGAGGNVAIYGGTVIAAGGNGGKGIGSGRGADGSLTLGEGMKMAISTDGKTWTETTDTSKRTRYMRVANHIHDGIPFQPWTKTDSLPDKEGSYYLTEDVTLSASWEPVNGTTNLCLNGCAITFDNTGENEDPVIKIEGGGTLNLYDEAENAGKITHAAGEGKKGGPGVYVQSSTLNMYGGTITGNNHSDSYGGGVVLSGSGDETFNMYGGTITGNSANGEGGGVFAYSGKINMYGGTISGNEAGRFGGGVCNLSAFTMSGGKISGNEAEKYGGGVYNVGTFTMSDGTISGNSAEDGGGVDIETNSYFTMSGGKIVENTATKHGGGIYNYKANLTVEGGEISHNVSQKDGGGLLCHNSTAKLSGNPVIKDNQMGTINEGVVTDGKDNNVVLRDSKIVIADALESTTPIGVSMVDNDYDPTDGVFTDSTGENVKKAKDYIGNFTSEISWMEIRADGDELKMVDTEVENVKALIEALPDKDDVKAEDAEAIAAARTAYDKLTAKQKKKVSEDAAEKIEACEEALTQTIAEGISKIEKIDNKEEVRALLDAYDKLIDSGKDAVDKLLGRKGVKKHADIEKALKIVDMIDDLKELEPIDAKDGQSIKFARTAYELLSEAQKDLIPETTRKQLEAAEKALDAAEAADALAAVKAAAVERLDDYAKVKALPDMTDAEKTEYGQPVTEGKEAINKAGDADAVYAALTTAKSNVNTAFAQIKKARVDAGEEAAKDDVANKAMTDANKAAEAAKAAADKAAKDEYASSDDQKAIAAAKAGVEKAQSDAKDTPASAPAAEKFAAAKAIDDAVQALDAVTDAVILNSAMAKAEAEKETQLDAVKGLALDRLEDFSELKALPDFSKAEKKAYDQAVAKGQSAIKAATSKDAIDAALKQAKKDVDAALAKIKKDRAESKAKKVKTVTVNVATVSPKAINSAVKKAGGKAKYVKTIILGKNVKKIKAKAFTKYKKAKTLQVKTPKLNMKSVKNSLRSSKVTTIKVKVGSKKANKKYTANYKKIFTRKNAGKKVKVVSA